MSPTKVKRGNANPPSAEQLTMAILRRLREAPNEELDLTTLARELGVEPMPMQLTIERLHRRGFLIAPFIEPGPGGGARLTQPGLRWLIAREGGTPRDVPVAFKLASGPVRAADEAARLPRAQVYGIRK